MKKFKISLALFLTVALIAAVFAGCAKKGDKTDSGNDTSKGEVTEVVTDKNGETVKADDSASSQNGESEGTSSENNNPGTSSGNAPSNGNTGSDSSGGAVTGSNSGNSGSSGGQSSNQGSSGSQGNITPPAGTDNDALDEAKLPDGVTLGKVSLYRLDKTVSIEIEVTNANGYDVVVDFSYLIIKQNDDKIVQHQFGQTPVAGGKTVKCSFPIEDTSVDLNIGRSVTVYYGNTPLGTAIVEKF